MSKPQTAVLSRAVIQVDLIGNTNVRQAPSRMSPILRVMRANDSVVTAGYTNAGENIEGNPSWYFTQDGSYIWAGATTRPNPSAAQPAIRLNAAPATTPAGIPASGIVGIDTLLAGNAQPLAEGSDQASVGAVQDLLSGHGFRGLPGLLSPVYGKFGPKTEESIRGFQKSRTITETGACDQVTLQQLIQTPANDPRLSCAYMTLVLGVPNTGLMRIVGLTAVMEGLGRFGSLNLNTDRAGLSFGLIQWAQRPRRLSDIVEAFSSADLPKFVDIFGDGREELAGGLLSHLRRPNGGVDPKTGNTTDGTYDLTSSEWVGRFQRAALDRQYQQIQLQVALAAFRQSLDSIRKYATGIDSERAVAFMLDVANQCGDGGLREMYQNAARQGASGMDLLDAIADETIERVAPNLQAGVRMRRDNFLNTTFLSDKPFVE